MKTFIILQNVASFRIHWSCLSNPNQYRLVLITSRANYTRLCEGMQEDYFQKVICTDNFQLEHLTTLVELIMREYEIMHREDVRIVTHDEYSLAVAAQLRQILTIDGAHPEEVEAFVNKLEMKRAVGTKGIRTPKYVPWQPACYQKDPDLYLAAVAELLSFPIFVKPINESGSVGTAKLEGHEQLKTWCETHRQVTNYELDEWVEGELYHCDSLLCEGQILYTHICKDVYPCYDYTLGKINGSYTLPKESEEFLQLAHFTRQVHAALEQKPRNTVTHLEVFRKQDDELVFLEIAARAPAALIPFMYEKHIGMNIEEAHFRLHMGLLHHFTPTYGPYSAYVYFPQRKGTVISLNQLALRSQSTWTWKIAPGDHLDNPDSIRETACTVLLWNENYQQLLLDLQDMDAFQAFTVTSEIALPVLGA